MTTWLSVLGCGTRGPIAQLFVPAMKRIGNFGDCLENGLKHEKVLLDP